MAKKFFDKVRSATATTGQSTLTLSGAYDASFASLAEAMAAVGAVDGDTTDYILAEGDDFEIVEDAVIGGGGTTVTRGTTAFSKIGGVAGTTKLDLAGAGQVRFFPSAKSLNKMLADILAKLSLSGGTLTGALTLHADPTLDFHAVTKRYVDGIAVNLGKRQRVRAATTANVTISTALNNGDTLDGVTLATGDLVLVKNQPSAQQNGVYVVGVTPVRAPEFDTYNEHPGSLIAVAEGSANADTLWLCTSNDGGTLDTTAITFAAFTALDATSLGAAIHAATTKAVPIGADEFGFWDSVSSALRRCTLSNLISAIKAGAAAFWAGTDDAAFLTSKAIADAGALVSLTSGTTINIDCSTGQQFIVDPLNHNATVAAPTNMVDGKVYTVYFAQGSTGGTLSFNSAYKLSPTPTASVGVDEVDILSFVKRPSDGTLISRFSKGS